jgi:hypothetical protein
MSRIHEALKRARREGEFPAIVPLPDRADAPPVHAVTAEPTLRHLSERGVRHARFTARGESVLARSYEAVERLCTMGQGLALGPEVRARTILVAADGAETDAAPVALALAATIAEKTKSRAAIVQLDSALDGGPGLRGLFTIEPPTAGDGSRPGLEPAVRGTPLGDLFLVPSLGHCLDRAVAAIAAEAGTPDGRPAPAAPRGPAALDPLLEWFSYVVIHGGAAPSDAQALGPAAEADAIVLVSPRADAPPEGLRALLAARTRPLRTVAPLR